MIWAAWITLAALALYGWLTANVSLARIKHKVNAPAMTGPAGFENAVRVQANTAEQLILFLPALWMCAYFLGEKWAFVGGVVWLIGRVLYALAYTRHPKKRGPGYAIALLATIALMGGTAVGLLTY